MRNTYLHSQINFKSLDSSSGNKLFKTLDYRFWVLAVMLTCTTSSIALAELPVQPVGSWSHFVVQKEIRFPLLSVVNAQKQITAQAGTLYFQEGRNPTLNENEIDTKKTFCLIGVADMGPSSARNPENELEEALISAGQRFQISQLMQLQNTTSFIVEFGDAGYYLDCTRPQGALTSKPWRSDQLNSIFKNYLDFSCRAMAAPKTDQNPDGWTLKCNGNG